MPQIRVDTEHVRDVGRRLIAESDRLNEIGHELQGAIGGLDTGAWDGHSRAQAEPLLSRVRPESARVSEDLDELGRMLVRVADTFEQEDNTAAHNLEGMPWVDFEASGPVSGYPGTGSAWSLLDRVSEWAKWAQILKGFPEIGASVLLAGGLTSGTTYIGQTIFHGGYGLKDLGGVSPYLTHIKDVNIPAHMAEKAFKSEFGKGNILLEGLSEVGENWEEYKGHIPQVATGIVVDTLIGIGGAAIGAGAGTLLVGTIGGMFLGPVGAVIGGKIGGVLGGWAGGEVADHIEDIKIGGRELDQAVVETITGWGQAGVQAVDQALDSFVDSVARLF